MTEDEYRGRKLVVEAVAPLLTVAGILLGVWQFHAGARETAEREREAAQREDVQEFRREVWREQLAVVRRIGATVGGVTSAIESGPQFDTAVQEFEALYWGPAIFVRDTTVERTLHDFHLGIIDLRAGREDGANRLRELGEAVVEASRLSLQREWRELGAAASDVPAAQATP